MPQKVKTFLANSWFSILTICGFVIHGYYTINYAQKDTVRAIAEIQTQIIEIPTLRAAVHGHTNDIAEMKKFLFRYDRTMNRFERNLDRVTWVVEELAKKEGIRPPKQITESHYE